MNLNQLRGSLFPLSRKYSPPVNPHTHRRHLRPYQDRQVYLPRLVRRRLHGQSRGMTSGRPRPTRTDFSVMHHERTSRRRGPRLLLVIPSQSREISAKLPKQLTLMVATRVCRLLHISLILHKRNSRRDNSLSLSPPYHHATWGLFLLTSSRGPQSIAMKSMACTGIDTTRRR